MMPRQTVYFRIGQAAKMLGISPSSLRNWERLGLLKPARSQGRYRLYSRESLEALRKIVYLRSVKGVNLAGIAHLKQTLKLPGSEKPASMKQRSIRERLAALRRSQSMTLAQVAHSTGLSVSFLSALERGRSNASIATLQKLSHLYKTNVLSFFGDGTGQPRRLVRPRDRKVLQQPGVKMELLAFGNTAMEPHLFRIAPGTSSGGSYHHEGEEFLYVLQGSIEVWLDEVERYVLEAGDSLYFESTMAHRWHSLSSKETVLLWINTPPTF
jgi:DNA-binding transcriptional MerR regulator/quercetin dioxygenase-like cupin family protein